MADEGKNALLEQVKRIKDNVVDAYAAAQEKGAMMPEKQNSDNLADTIKTITGSGGGGEEGYIQTDFYDLFLTGEYGYFSPEVCEQLMKGTYVLEEV